MALNAGTWCHFFVESRVIDYGAIQQAAILFNILFKAMLFEPQQPKASFHIFVRTTSQHNRFL